MKEGGFPGETLQINTRTKIKYLRDMNPLKYRDERISVLYSTPAVATLRRFVGIPGMEYEDYAAINAVIQSMLSNYGNPTFNNWLTMRDVNTRIMDLFGTGIRKADPFKVIDDDFYADMFDWALTTGLQCARSVPSVEVVKLHLDSYELRSAQKLEFAIMNTYPLESYGSKSEPHFAMPSNVVPSGCFVLPVAVRKEMHPARKGWTDLTNILEWMDKERWPETKAVSVSQGDIAVPFEEFMKTIFYRLQFQVMLGEVKSSEG